MLSQVEDLKGKTRELFRQPLREMINRNHELVILSKHIDWDALEREFSGLYELEAGRPGKPIRLMVSLHYLKYTYNLSDEEVVVRWLENPYWQYFSGMAYFQTEFPIHPTSMTKFRKRLKDRDLEKLLEATIQSGLDLKVIKRSSFKRVNADTTVMEKAISFPTDGKLYYRAIEKLVTLAKRYGIELRQSYLRVGKQALIWSQRYAHSRKMKKARAQVRRLRTYLGRLYRDVRRKLEHTSEAVRGAFKELLSLVERLLNQQRSDKNKLYSLHEPHVSCIAKGKAHKKYEFGSKVSIVSTSREGFIVGSLNFQGNPYDGHTLGESIAQMERICGHTPEKIFADKGYRGHNYKGDAEVYLPGQHRKKGAPPRRWFKRRSAVEATISHVKQKNRLGRNYLKGPESDGINALLAACGHNLRLILRSISFLPQKIDGFLSKLLEKLVALSGNRRNRVLRFA